MAVSDSRKKPNWMLCQNLSYQKVCALFYVNNNTGLMTTKDKRLFAFGVDVGYMFPPAYEFAQVSEFDGIGIKMVATTSSTSFGMLVSGNIIMLLIYLLVDDKIYIVPTETSCIALPSNSGTITQVCVCGKLGIIATSIIFCVSHLLKALV